MLGASLLSAVMLAYAGLLPAPHRAHAQPTPPATLSPERFGKFGLIETEVRQVRRPSCWTLVLRGKLHNPYDQPVSDVGVIVRLRGAGETPRELERIEFHVKAVIEPGESAPFRRELTTACTSTYSDIAVVAFAHRRGAAELPAPAPEVEVEASQVKETAYGAGNVPIVNSPVGITGRP